ncbi:major facilitator superfamily domain-containing protein [Pseudomassariella vexata]|uniref:Major facilitator superfamily domain-containing protein n=1 Tax=Pseudomassariella vexata TaxID=1141098 RepID=A0A1Y2E0W3_9PEZI|nr:major facilitator superfamily domain-containing protein [Pseudomassariella vexata]ORY65191.1 major facilitator superfamily domain-containing protein [Pseudomassariella vexata]
MGRGLQPTKNRRKQIDMVDTLDETTPLLGADTQRYGDSGNESTQNHSWAGLEDFEDVPQWRRPSVYWLLGPYFLFTVAFGGVIVPKLNLIIDLVCHNYFADRALEDPTFPFLPVVLGSDNPQCTTPVVQRSVATFTLVTTVLVGILCALTAPKLGSLSDRFGRTKLLCVASCGGVVNEIITILAAKYPDAINYRWLILGSFFDGITGSFTAGSILGASYTSDCSPPSKRGVYMGYLHASLFTGLAFGPLLSGYFVKWTGSLLSIFYVTLGCHIFFILFILFVTPESLSEKRQMIAREKYKAEQDTLANQLRCDVPNALARVIGPTASDMTSYRMGKWLPALLNANPFAPLKILVPRGHHNASLRRNMIILALIDTVILAAAFGSGTVTILYVEYIFDWGNFEASRFLSLLSFTRVFILLGGFPFFNYFFRPSALKRQRQASGQGAETNSGADELDIWMLRLALFSDVAGILGYAVARSGELFVISGIIASFGGLARTPERVGSLLGAIGLLHALGRVFSPIMFNGLYAATVDLFPQAFFVLLTSIFGLALMASLFLRPHVFLKEDDYGPVPTATVEADRVDADAVVDAEVAVVPVPRV